MPGCPGIGACGARSRLSGAWEDSSPSSQPPCIHVTIGPFVPSDCGLGARKWSEAGSQKSLGDCNPEREPEPTRDTADTVVLSLSGGLADSGDISVGMLNCGPPTPPRIVTEPRGREKRGKTPGWGGSRGVHDSGVCGAHPRPASAGHLQDPVKQMLSHARL